MSLSENLNAIHERIRNACAACGRNPDDIMLIAVSKTKPNSMIQEAHDAGQLHFGENKVQELQDKMPAFGDDIQWHMIGTLQTNKIKFLVDRVNWIHSVPKIKALKEIEKRAGRIDRVIDVLIQVNISDEDQKSGCAPEDLAKLLEYASELKWVRVRGLMGIATFADDPEIVRPEFRMLKQILEEHQRFNAFDAISLEHLSMGMTNDLEVAIEEGATMVRVGSAIFGEREY